MKRVKTAIHAPGACITGISHVDLIDFEIDIPQGRAGRLYLWEQYVRDAARQLGFAEPDEHARVLIQLRGVKETTDRVAELERELKALRSAVRMTLLYGAVEDKRSGKPLLRLPPKMKRAEAGM